jgi:hypothetical protein
LAHAVSAAYRKLGDFPNVPLILGDHPDE